ncbi:MAG: hypothetical protein ABID09_05625 [Candidatus Omnitrophota bacterium]
MRFKPRTILVVFISSLIISSVLAITMFSFYAYIEWKANNDRRNYRQSVLELNGELFGKYVIVNLRAQVDTDGAFRGKPIVVGTIRNNSDKTIYSLKLKISFAEADEHVVYVDTFYPIGPGTESLVNIGEFGNTTRKFLLKGDSISFNHQLTNCPTEVFNYLISRLKLAKGANEMLLKLSYKTEALDIR